MTTPNATSTPQLATFGGGCFWCLEAVFLRLRGVRRVESGYAGGHVDAPKYADVCEGTTGHAEVVQVEFDPGVIGYRDLLDVFFGTHDPTTLNRQGHDVGTQYRSAVFTHDEGQQAVATQRIAELAQEGVFGDPIVTTVEPLERFWPAEIYHRNYYDRNPGQPYCMAVIAPKVAKLRKSFAHRLKE